MKKNATETKERFDHIWQRLAVDSSSSSRLILLQSNHGSLSWRRQAADSSNSRQKEEERRKPWQAAHPPLWMAYMMRQLLLAQTPPRIVYWCTTTTLNTAASWLPPSVQTVHSMSGPDPFRWEEASTSSSSSVLPLNDLQACCEYFVQHTPRAWLFVESLQPLLVLHGFAATWAFLQTLMAAQYTLVLPTTRLLTVTQHRVLEDAAWGLLVCWQDDDSVTFLRRGIRESSHALRQSLHYRVVEDMHASSMSWRLEIIQDDNDDHVVNDADDTVPEQKTKASSRGKVSLQFEKEDTSSKPRIYLQDDDPERKDYYYYSDEEDPDDDLDL